METKLQHADGGMGRRVHGCTHRRRDHCQLLRQDKTVSNGCMDRKMIKLIMAAQLAFFFLAGFQMVDNHLAAAKREGVVAVLVTMPMRNLSEISI